MKAHACDTGTFARAFPPPVAPRPRFGKGRAFRLALYAPACIFCAGFGSFPLFGKGRAFCIKICSLACIFVAGML